MNLLLIALGGGLGALARYGVGLALDRHPETFPLGTLSVNVCGALLLGVLLAWLSGTDDSERLRLLAGVGFLGSFTTFSTFSVEIVRLSENGGWLRAATYAGTSLGLGILAVLAGAWIGNSIRGN